MEIEFIDPLQLITMENLNSLKTRAIAFGYEALSLIVTGLLGILASEEFASLITTHWGETIYTSLALLILTGAIKYVRNWKILKDAEEFGSVEDRKEIVII